MARPPVIQKLRHNRLLCGSVFRWFVETWNWLTSYVDNLKGDGDVNAQSGCITIDRTDPDAPVIRFDINKLPSAAAGGGKAIPQPFDPTFEKDDETGEIHLSDIGNGYAPWGRSLIYVAPPNNSSDVWTETSARLGLKITHPTTYSAPPTAEIVILGSYRDSSGASQTPSFPASTDTISYLPLYDFTDGRITLDLRCYLALGAFE